MFYLLENNTIVDSKNLRKDLSDGTLLEPVFDIEKEGNKIHYYFEGNLFNTLEIKNQSENVFELINKKEDLVKIDGQIIMARTIQGDIKNLSGISAIYKPDEKSNYIKIWELG